MKTPRKIIEKAIWDWDITPEQLKIKTDQALKEIEAYYLSKIPSKDEIDNETFKVMLCNKEYQILPDYYVKKIVNEVIHNLVRLI